jgi:hypothetical protein
LPAGFRRVVNNATGDIEFLGPDGTVFKTEAEVIEAARKAVADGAADAQLGVNPAARLPVPATPPNMTASSFGSNLIRWGTGADAAAARTASLTSADVQQMVDQGLTKSMAANWEAFYQSAVANGRGGDVAAARANLMKLIIEKWPN